MRKVASILSPSLRREVVAGGVAGLAGGLVFWWAIQAQGMTATVPGLLGIKLFGVGTALHLLVSALLGAGFGAMLRYQPRSHAAILSTGSLYGLLWWIAGPITLGALLDGRGPTWSLGDASVAFPSLVGHLLYGGITGFGFYILVALYLRLLPQAEPVVSPADAFRYRNPGMTVMPSSQRPTPIAGINAAGELPIMTVYPSIACTWPGRLFGNLFESLPTLVETTMGWSASSIRAA